jgi:cytochrome bd-type quinol oxidase subunit 2
MDGKTIKRALKRFGRYVWELFKSSLPSTFMYCCAGTILLMLTVKGETLHWTSKEISWTVVCIVGGAAYNALMAWANGGMQYEMLVSGNVKRMSAEQFDGGYKMSNHKEAKEYRVWKGFVAGAITALLTLVIGILFGCNQAKINAEEMEKGAAILTLIGFLLSGWSVIPLYLMNATGIAVSYFLSCIFAIIPIAVTGGFYIAGAYARRNKRIREQIIAERAAKAEENKVKKINYGGLPGTKPKKRK